MNTYFELHGISKITINVTLFNFQALETSKVMLTEEKSADPMLKVSTESDSGKMTSKLENTDATAIADSTASQGALAKNTQESLEITTDVSSSGIEETCTITAPALESQMDRDSGLVKKETTSDTTVTSQKEDAGTPVVSTTTALKVDNNKDDSEDANSVSEATAVCDSASMSLGEGVSLTSTGDSGEKIEGNKILGCPFTWNMDNAYRAFRKSDYYHISKSNADSEDEETCMPLIKFMRLLVNVFEYVTFDKDIPRASEELSKAESLLQSLVAE